MSEFFHTLVARRNGKDLLCEMLRANVIFMVVGGCAMHFWNLRNAHDVADLDLLIDPAYSNVSALQTVLIWFDRPLDEVARFTKPRAQIHLDSDQRWAFDADIMTPYSSSFDFESALATAASESFYGLNLKIASIRTMVELKEAAVASASKPDAREDVKAKLPRHESDLAALRRAAD